MLAGALGIQAGRLAELDHALDQEQARAQAINVALWWPSCGSFLDHINALGAGGATLSASAHETARELHRDAVRGRGPLPAIRVGYQPYGVLPVSGTDRSWVPDPDGFEDKLLPLLRKLRNRWRACLDQVARAGFGDVDRTMLALLGTSPISLGLRARAVVGHELATLGLSWAGGQVRSDHSATVSYPKRMRD